jgi:hypothetical protein
MRTKLPWSFVLAMWAIAAISAILITRSHKALVITLAAVGTAGLFYIFYAIRHREVYLQKRNIPYCLTMRGILWEEDGKYFLDILGNLHKFYVRGIRTPGKTDTLMLYVHSELFPRNPFWVHYKFYEADLPYMKKMEAEFDGK